MANNNKRMGRPTKRPSAEELAGLLKEHSTDEISKMFGVTENTVRNWIKILLIPNDEKKRKETRNEQEFVMDGDGYDLPLHLAEYMREEDYFEFLALLAGISREENKALMELRKDRYLDSGDGRLKIRLGGAEIARIAEDLGISATWVYQLVKRLTMKGYMLRTSKKEAVYTLNDVIFKNASKVYGFSVDYYGGLAVANKVTDLVEDFKVDDHNCAVIMPETIIMDRSNSRFAWILPNKPFESNIFLGDELISTLNGMPIFKRHLDGQEYTAAYFHEGCYVGIKAYRLYQTWFGVGISQQGEWWEQP